MRRYLDEPGHQLVLDEMDAAITWCAAEVTRMEVAAVFHRLAWDDAQRRSLLAALTLDWEAIAVVPIDTRLLTRATEIANIFGLGTVDAIQLAAADRLPRPARYLTFSSSQIPAAAELGLEVISS